MNNNALYDFCKTDTSFMSLRKETFEVRHTPDNRREMPCETCPLANQCAEKLTECSGFRNWTYNGDYDDKDVGRLIRAIK